MALRSAFFLTVALLALAGCGSESDAATLKGALTYSRTGGLSGVSDKLAVQSDGAAKVTTRKGSKSFKLSKDERTRLTKALANADLANVKVNATPPVPDAFQYALHYRTSKFAFNDTNMPKALKPVVSELNKLVKAHAPG